MKLNPNLLTFYMGEEIVTAVWIGSYQHPNGEEMVLLASIRPENMLHIPKKEAEALFAPPEILN